MECVEISDGTIAMDEEDKLASCAGSASEFKVLSEVGSKDDAVVITPSTWVDSIKRELEAGAWKVITEGRESGTVGIYRPNGDVKDGLLEEIRTAVRHVADLLFEAPIKKQQAWFIKQFGANVNLGNIPPEEVISVETLRVGVRGDTLLTSTDGGRAPSRSAPRLAMTLLLVRHGQTDWNREPARCQGWAEVELNEVGRAQARDLGRALAGAASSSSSPATCCAPRETAELIREELGAERPRSSSTRGSRRRTAASGRRAASRHHARGAETWRALPRAPGDVPLPRRREPRDQQRRVLACLRDCGARRAHDAARDARRQHPPHALLPEGRRARRLPRMTTANGGVDEIATDGLSGASTPSWTGTLSAMRLSDDTGGTARRAGIAVLGAPMESEALLEGVNLMPAALRTAGLIGALRAADLGDLPISITDTERDAGTGLVAYGQVCAATHVVRDGVLALLDRSELPLVVGGCCGILVGIFAALRRSVGRAGLAFVDGHYDFYDGATSPAGALADMELRVLTGAGPDALVSAGGAPPLLEPRDAWVLGVRDAWEMNEAGAPDPLVEIAEAHFRTTAP